MWYFTWILGIGFAVLLAILNTLWGDHEEDRRQQTPAVPTPPTDASPNHRG